MRQDLDLLLQAQSCYMALERFRRDRERNKRYNYGDQWGDTITADGVRMKEEDYIRHQGSEPLKNNLIRRLVRNVIGVYSSQKSQTRCYVRDEDEKRLGDTMTTLLEYNGELNRLTAMYVRTLEEFLISGLAVHRKWYGTLNGRTDCWTDYVQPNNFFIDSNMRDFRAWDCQCIGEIHDVTLAELCSQFADSPEKCELLRSIYSEHSEHGFGNAEFGSAFPFSSSFLTPRHRGLCRVIEIWRKEQRAYYRCHNTLTGKVFRMGLQDFASLPETDKKSIKATWTTEEVWRYYFLSPSGHILSEGDTPYSHGQHPYVVKAYPLIDGEIHAFVSDVIDQQRYTNRLITMYDWIVRSSAKGVLLVPQDCLPKGVKAEDFADTWSRFNGVLMYKPSAYGEIPKQISNNATNIGITELLNLQLKFFEDISGVNGALEGKLSNSAMSAELYGQQTQNATMALQDVLGTFREFVRDAAYKDVSNMQQFYDDITVRSIAGKNASLTDNDMSKIHDLHFDLIISASDTTSASREATNRMLIEIWKSGQISLEQMLEAGDFPFKITKPES